MNIVDGGTNATIGEERIITGVNTTMMINQRLQTG